MTEVKYEISVRYINGVAGVLRHKYAVTCRPINHSRFNGKSNIFF